MFKKWRVPKLLQNDLHFRAVWHCSCSTVCPEATKPVRRKGFRVRIAETGMRSKRSGMSQANEEATRLRASRLRARIRADLAERGVDTDAVEILFQELEGQGVDLDSARYQALLAGVAAACRAGVEEDDPELLRNTAELREIERMMGAFADELAKLDETLEVLSAYVRRMRANVEPRSKRLLQ